MMWHFEEWNGGGAGGILWNDGCVGLSILCARLTMAQRPLCVCACVRPRIYFEWKVGRFIFVMCVVVGLGVCACLFVCVWLLCATVYVKQSKKNKESDLIFDLGSSQYGFELMNTFVNWNYNII